MTAVALTAGLSILIVVAFTLIVVGPQLADFLAHHFAFGDAFVWTWKIAQWPLAFGLVVVGIGLIYYFAGIDGTVANQPQQGSPDEVGRVAAKGHQTYPQAFNQALQFFSDHPALVKVLGARTGISRRVAPPAGRARS